MYSFKRIIQEIWNLHVEYLMLKIHPNIRPLGYFLFNKSCRSEILQMKW